MQQSAISFNGQKQRTVFLVFVTMLVFVLYGNTINHSYNIDDQLVTQNHRLTSKGVTAIPEIFTSPYYEDDQGYAYEYRPVLFTTFAIEYSLFGESPNVSHFINLLFYAISTILLFQVLIYVFPQFNLLFPFLVTLFFVAHPLHTEAVSSIKNRDEILSFIGGLTALFFAVKFIKSSKWFYLSLMAAAFTLGLLSKMSILPYAIILLFFVVFFVKSKLWQLFSLQVPILIIAGIIAPFNSFTEKMFFLAVLFFAPLILYAFSDVQRLKSIIQFTGKKIKNYDQPIKSNFLNQFSEKGTKQSKFLYPNLFNSIFLFVTLLILSLVFLVYGMATLQYSIAAVSVIILAAIYWLGNASIRTLSFLFIILYCGLVGVFAGAYVSLYIVLHAILLGLYSKHRETRFFYGFILLLFIPFALLNKFGNDSFVIALGMSLSYLFYKGKFGQNLFKIILGAFLILAIGHLIEFFESGLVLKDVVIPFVTLMTMLAIYFNRKLFVIRRTVTLFSVLVLFIILIFTVETEKRELPPLTSEEKQELVNLDNELKRKSQQAPVFLSPQNFFSTDRPIDFVEMPLEYGAPLNEKLGTSFYVLGEYLKKMVFPYEMGFYYGYAEVVPVGLDNPQALISLIIHALLLLAALYLLYKRKHLIVSFGIIYYLACISVFSNILYPVVGMMADRFTYVASLGFCIVLAYLLMKAFKIDMSKDAKRIHLKPGFIAVMLLILGAYSYKTIARNALWKDPLTLMEHDIKHLNKSAQAHNLLASFSMTEFTKTSDPQLQKKYVNQGVKHFRKATEIYPEFFNAWYDLGRANMVKRDDAAAINAFKKVLEIDSTFTDAIVSIASIYQQNNMLKESVPYYRKAIRHTKSSNLQFYNSLSYTWFRLEEYDEAIKVGQSAIEEHPNTFAPLSNLGKTYLQIGDTITAVNYLEQAFEIRQDPNLAGFISKYYREKNNIKKANYYNSFMGQQ